MTLENTVADHAASLAHVMSALSTRTLNHFAEEAKQNGESLKDAFERYEIDYAWHVLGSDRLRDATLSCLLSRHRHVATDAQKDSLSGILKSAAQAQPSELLMSFDNEVPEKLADFLSASWTGTPAGAPAAAAN
jgi:hypothetical protein